MYVRFEVESGGEVVGIMGDAVAVTGTPRFHLVVVSSSSGTSRIPQPDLVKVTLFRDGDQVVYEDAFGPRESRTSLDLYWEDLEAPQGEASYYARVIQEDDHVAWTSPIWVTR